MAQQGWFEGQITHVRDIDTIEVNGVPIRFNGIDGPELSSQIGQDGKRWLSGFVGRSVVCHLNGEQTRDRRVGTCYLPDGVDIGALAISRGWARDCPRYSKGRYQSFETKQSRSLPQSDYCVQ